MEAKGLLPKEPKPSDSIRAVAPGNLATHYYKADQFWLQIPQHKATSASSNLLFVQRILVPQNYADNKLPQPAHPSWIYESNMRLSSPIITN